MSTIGLPSDVDSILLQEYVCLVFNFYNKKNNLNNPTNLNHKNFLKLIAIIAKIIFL